MSGDDQMEHQSHYGIDRRGGFGVRREDPTDPILQAKIAICLACFCEEAWAILAARILNRGDQCSRPCDDFECCPSRWSGIATLKDAYKKRRRASRVEIESDAEPSLEGRNNPKNIYWCVGIRSTHIIVNKFIAFVHHDARRSGKIDIQGTGVDDELELLRRLTHAAVARTALAGLDESVVTEKKR